MNLSQRHQSQINAMIGKKVRVYVAGRFHERVLREDHNDLYVKLNGVNVSVRPDTNTLNVLYFVGHEPKKQTEVALSDSEEVKTDLSNSIAKHETVKQPSLALRIWQVDALHAELEQNTLNHIALAKEFSDKGTSSERRTQILDEINQLRAKRESLINGDHNGKEQQEVPTVYIYYYDFDEARNTCKSGLTESEEEAKQYPMYAIASIDDLRDEIAASGFVYKSPVRVKEGIVKYYERGSWDWDAEEEFECGYDLIEESVVA
ncbi:hypothetical protein QYF48_12080 [Brevibacillus agri]|uniref:hypothetical protein n=1 Tax=Brevibacillus agri TaxID=51101 RepID=UPI0025B6AE4B|nr:hypothetical protein [Brevibacillus agri]MDN4093553.1 hypothetical protein [Brevibacillus agri]